MLCNECLVSADKWRFKMNITLACVWFLYNLFRGYADQITRWFRAMFDFILGSLVKTNANAVFSLMMIQIEFFLQKTFYFSQNPDQINFGNFDIQLNHISRSLPSPLNPSNSSRYKVCQLHGFNCILLSKSLETLSYLNFALTRNLFMRSVYVCCRLMNDHWVRKEPT